MNPSQQRLAALAVDLRAGPPRSPHATLGGFVTAARSLDKCRASLLGINGEYSFDPCSLARLLWDFTGVQSAAFRDFVATGATDDEVGVWLLQHSRVQDRLEILKWNNHLKCLRISELPDTYQAYLDEYIPKFCPRPNTIRFFFDVYDSEEGRL